MKFLSFLIIAASFSFCSTSTHQSKKNTTARKQIKTGADQTEKYLPYLKGKRVAMMANLTSIIGKTHLVDSLKKLGVNIVKVFGPEHGFRGNASAGVHVAMKKILQPAFRSFLYMAQKTNPVKKTLPM